MTSNLSKRISQHKEGITPGFTSKYRVKKLIFFEEFREISNAIDREKQLKRWSRKKKVWLVKRQNPEMQDLYDDLVY